MNSLRLDAIRYAGPTLHGEQGAKSGERDYEAFDLVSAVVGEK